MFNGDRLNDEYERHRRRTASLIKDDLDRLIGDARVSRPRWYNELMAQIGEGLIAVGSSLKERNSTVRANQTIQQHGG